MCMKESTNWNIPVPRSLDDALEMAVEDNNYSSKSEFVRDSVRRLIAELNH